MDTPSDGKRKRAPGAGRPAIYPPGRRKITVLLPPDVADKLADVADRLGESVTRIAATAIGQWLKKR